MSDNFTGGRLTTLLAPFGASLARFFTNAIGLEAVDQPYSAKRARAPRDQRASGRRRQTA